MSDTPPKRRRREATPAGKMLEAEARASNAIKKALRRRYHCGVRVLPPEEGQEVAAHMLRDHDVVPKLRHYVGPLDIGCKDQYQQFQVDGARFAYRLDEPKRDTLAAMGLRELVSNPLAFDALTRGYAQDPEVDPLRALEALGFASVFARVASRAKPQPSPLEALKIAV